MKILRYLLPSNGGTYHLVRLFGRHLPSSKFNQLTPLNKLRYWTGFSLKIKDGNKWNYLIEKSSGQVESSIIKTVSESLADVFPSPFTNALLKQQKSRLTAYNHWRVFLWGRGAAHRGRETYNRKLISSLLRASGFGTPQQGINTATLVWALAMIKKWWQSRSQDELPPTQPQSPPPKPISIKSNAPYKSMGVQFPAMVTTRKIKRSLRDLVVRALTQMGMSYQGANDLIDGKPVFGPDANIYRSVCKLIFIQCLTCDQMAAIEHEQLFYAVIYLPEDDVLVSWCPNCDRPRLVRVTTVVAGDVIALL